MKLKKPIIIAVIVLAVLAVAVICIPKILFGKPSANSETTSASITFAEETETQTQTETALSAEESLPDVSTVPEETEPQVPVAAPVNGSVADIVKYYNNAVNGVCSKTVKVKRTTEMTGELVESSAMVEAFLGDGSEMLGESEPVTETKSFVNGKASDMTLGEFMPRGNGTPSELTAAGVEKISCTVSGNNYKVVIAIKDESGDSMDWTPVHHQSCMGLPTDSGFGLPGGNSPGNGQNEMPSRDNNGESPEDMDVEGTMSMTYYDGTITAVIDPYGNILSLDISNPARMSMDMKMSLLSMSMTMEMKTRQQYTFTY